MRKASFLPPGLVFLRPYLRRSGEEEKRRKPTLQRAVDHGRRKVSFVETKSVFAKFVTAITGSG